MIRLSPTNPNAKPGEERTYPSTMRVRRQVDLIAIPTWYPPNATGDFVCWANPISEIIVFTNIKKYNIDALSANIFGSRGPARVFVKELAKRDKYLCTKVGRWDLKGVYVPLALLNRFLHQKVYSLLMRYSISTLVRYYLATDDPDMEALMQLQRKNPPITAYDIPPDSERDKADLSLLDETQRFDLIHKISYHKNEGFILPMNFSQIFNDAVTLIIHEPSSTYNITTLSIDLFASTQPVTAFFNNCSEAEKSLFIWKDTELQYSTGYYVPPKILRNFSLLHTTTNTNAILTLVQFHTTTPQNPVEHPTVAAN